jgi:hypothetical protein
LSERAAAAEVIQNEQRIDSLVTYALRQVGYGNDGWVVTYWTGQDDDDEIPEGYIDICCIGCGDEIGIKVREDIYISELIKACRQQELVKRADLLGEFLQDRDLSRDLVEADAGRCLERWKRLLPFLKKNGWYIEEEMIVSPGGGRKINTTAYIGDLNVMFREISQDLTLNDDNVWQHDCNTLLNALKELFLAEDDAALFKE